MRDILPAAPAVFARAITPLARILSLRTLPLHIHEILPTFAFYHFLDILIAPQLSRRLCPALYSSFNERTKKNWNAHVVSFVQASIINSVALWVIFNDDERARMDPLDRVWGYTGAIGMTQALSAGYFLWDLMASTMRPDVHGTGAAMHAAAAVAFSVLGFRPFCNYYGINFVLYELSTPFLNIHWFMDKAGWTGSTAQLINGVALITSFGGARLVWGTYQNYCMYSDIWAAWSSPSTGLPVPLWLASVYIVASATLTGLNMVWFGKMIKALVARFDSTAADGDGKKVQ